MLKSSAQNAENFCAEKEKNGIFLKKFIKIALRFL